MCRLFLGGNGTSHPRRPKLSSAMACWIPNYTAPGVLSVWSKLHTTQNFALPSRSLTQIVHPLRPSGRQQSESTPLGDLRTGASAAGKRAGTMRGKGFGPLSKIRRTRLEGARLQGPSAASYALVSFHSEGLQPRGNSAFIETAVVRGLGAALLHPQDYLAPHAISFAWGSSHCVRNWQPTTDNRVMALSGR